MWKYVRNNWKSWVIGVFVPAFASAAANIYYAGRLENYSAQIMAPQPSFRAIAKMLVFAIFVLLLLSGIDDIGRYIFSVFTVSVENEMKHDFYKALVRAPLKELQKLHQGELLTHYNIDTVRSAAVVTKDVQGIFYQLIVGIGYLTAALVSNVWLGLVMLLLGVGVIIQNYLYLRKQIVVEREILHANEEYALNCSSAIQGKMSIRQYAAEQMMIQKIVDSSRVLYQKECQSVHLKSLKMLTSDGLANVCTYLLTPAACVFAAYGYIGIPTVLFIHQICRCFIMYTQNFANLFVNYSAHMLSYRRICPVLSLPDEPGICEKSMKKPSGKYRKEKQKNNFNKEDFDKKDLLPNVLYDSISFEDVSVSYGAKQVLSNVTFTIHTGEIVGIVGESGSGKSTLIKALMRMIDYQGEIRIGEKDCCEIPMTDLRLHIAYVPEHSDLFHDTVYQNIQYGRPEASADEIDKAMERAALTDRADFGCRDAGENGSRLSGGQRQRVSIARALVKNAPIIILDEPTAALDTESEAVILNTISALKEEGKCVLLITHKESTLSIADRVLRIENGNLISF